MQKNKKKNKQKIKKLAVLQNIKAFRDFNAKKNFSDPFKQN